MVDGLVAVVVVVLVAWLVRVGARVRAREELLARIAEVDPAIAQAARAPARAAFGTWRAAPRPRYPANPWDLSTHVVVEPYGDGRPGMSFSAPGPAEPPQAVAAADLSRQDAMVRLRPGTYLLVVGLGPLGYEHDGYARPDARQRALDNAAHLGAGERLIGPVAPVHTGAGPGWQVTRLTAAGYLLTDTHVDHGRWTYVIGVLTNDGWHHEAVALLERILATWTWIEPQ